MYNGYNKIFWGIIVTSFHINLGIIKILPSFIGFLIIMSGIKEIYEESRMDEFEDVKNLSIFMAIIAFIGEMIDFFTQGQIGYFFPNIIWTVFYAAFELVFFFKLLETSIEYLKINNYLDEEGQYIEKLRKYTIFSLLSISLISMSLILNLPMYINISALVAIGIRIYLMTIVYSLRNIFLAPETIEEE